jgi:Mg2+-importing ATPase
MEQLADTFWSLPPKEVLRQLGSSHLGLTSAEAADRLRHYGPNSLNSGLRLTTFSLLFGQFKSPIIIILLAATALALFLGDPADGVIILVIVLASGLLGFWQERSATNAVARLLAIVQIRSTVVRDGLKQDIPVEDVVPGDVVLLTAGDVLPGDCLIIESKDLFADEATLTGETYPVEKETGLIAASTVLSGRTNVLYMGTHVISGAATAVVVKTGSITEFGKISARLKLRPEETEFERGVKRFGYLLMEVTLILVLAIFGINVFFKRPIIEALLFSLALGVGLTPQLLPAIISINLSHGASRMAQKKVVVKRLASIENFGSMNVLCADKTGTLTEGIVRLDSALDTDGKDSDKVLLWAYLNSFYETGFTNPIDRAVLSGRKPDISGYEKLDEVPYDFIRKRLSVLVAKDGISTMVTKGALENVLKACSTAEIPGGMLINIDTALDGINSRYEELSNRGFRILGIAYNKAGGLRVINRGDEKAMTFLGFLVFSDQLKEGISETVSRLKQAGVELKIISGDNRFASANVSRQVGLDGAKLLSGADISVMSDEALLRKVNEVDVFAQIEPNQKERLITALKKAGNVVGFIGDGINDASALHAADVGISVDTAVDVAKDTADIVLLEKDLRVLEDGIREGRMTFSNTLKYVFMATSANFGNMFSMAGASLIMPFLPLLPKQVLLTNLLTDLPEMTIASDNVDKEMVEKPRRWDIKFIRNFMLMFGLISSIFDFTTFAILLLILHASPAQFRTGWFIESVISASVIVLVIRTRRLFLRSRPGKYLVLATLLVVAAVLIFPYIGMGRLFGFESLPAYFLLIVAIIVVVYAGFAEIAKYIFYKRMKM